jgi:predicted transcriptional regulator
LEFEIASKCDGTKTYREIAEKMGVDLEIIYGAMTKLKELGLVKEETP